MIRIFSIIPRNSYGVKNAFFWQLCFAKILGECQNRSLYFCTHLSAKMGVSIHCTQIEKSISNFRNSFWKPWFWHPISDFGNHPDPEAPYWSCSEETPPVGGPIFWQSHRSPMPLSNFAPVGGAVVRVAGPLLEPPVPPLVQLRAVPGPWCGASVGTTGSAPCAGASRQTCPPKNVRSNRNFTSVYAKKYDFWPGKNADFTSRNGIFNAKNVGKNVQKYRNFTFVFLEAE